MQQKNKFTQNYFAFAIYSVFFTSLLFIIFGSNGWGPSAANEQAIGEISRWCERVSGGFFREPVNTLGNLGFVAAGLFMFYKITQDATNNRNPLFGSFKIALLYASLIEAYTFMKGEQDMMVLYNQKFQEALVGIKMLGEAKEVTDEFRTGKVIRPKQ